jgi:hypothetical protein
LAYVLITEFATVAVGGSIGAFLYVTFHFILNPLLGVVVTVLALLGIRRVRAALRPLAILGSAAALGIAYLGITGSPWLTQALGLSFR